jgi:hypothetical protein
MMKKNTKINDYFAAKCRKSESSGIIDDVQHAQRDLARNHSGPTSVKSRKCRRNKKKSRC